MSSFFKSKTSNFKFTFFFYLAIMLSQNSFAASMEAHTNNPDHLSMYFVTWNVAAKHPEQDLHSLLNLIKSNETEQKLPDMYIIGLQEVKSQIQDMVSNLFVHDPWTQSFRAILKKYNYVKIGTVRMVGVLINIFSLRKHIPHLRFMEYEYTKTGFNGLWGNKGAVSFRMDLYGVNVCFVNTHLPPHDNALKNRIDDYETIMKYHLYKNPETSHILYHDYVFWIGDLNFRLNNNISAADIVSLVKKNNLGVLLEKDQLLMVRNDRTAFFEFTEEKITFPPTYKYEFTSQEFDLKRRPSWTDRILYKVNADSYKDSKLSAVQLNYKSHPFYVQSDHKPVTAEFNITTRPNYESESIELIVSTWYLEEQNSLTYRILRGYKPEETDYIGLFHDDFDSLDEYIVYEYVKVFESGDEQSSENHLYFSLEAVKSPGMYRLIYFSQKQSALSVLGISSSFNISQRDTSTVQNRY